MRGDVLKSNVFKRIGQYGATLVLTGGMGLYGLMNSGCSEKTTNIVDAVDCDTCNAIDTSKYFDICNDVSFEISYADSSLPGVKSIYFKKVPNDDCGYISEHRGNLIGREEPWQVMGVETKSSADPLEQAVNDSLAQIVRSDIIGEVILNKIWLKDSLGNNASIIANTPYSATHIEVFLDSREIPDTSQWITRNGVKMMPGVGGYIRNGNIEVIVNAYGERRSSKQSTYHLIKIVNPTLLDYNPKPTL